MANFKRSLIPLITAATLVAPSCKGESEAVNRPITSLAPTTLVPTTLPSTTEDPRTEVGPKDGVDYPLKNSARSLKKIDKETFKAAVAMSNPFVEFFRNNFEKADYCITAIPDKFDESKVTYFGEATFDVDGNTIEIRGLINDPTSSDWQFNEGILGNFTINGNKYLFRFTPLSLQISDQNKHSSMILSTTTYYPDGDPMPVHMAVLNVKKADNPVPDVQSALSTVPSQIQDFLKAFEGINNQVSQSQVTDGSALVAC